MVILETARLVLREMTPDDAEQTYLLNIDPLVIQYTGDKAFESIDAARQFMESYDHYQRYGFGRWATIRKEDNAFLGWCGLKYMPEVDEYDLGYRFFRKYWGQGYATEAASACLHLGFTRFQMPRIVGRAMSANTASIRVLEKVGLRFQYPYSFDGEDGVLYALDQSSWQESQAHHQL